MLRLNYQPTARLTAGTITAALLVSLASPFTALASATSSQYTDHSSRVTTGEVADTLRHTSGVLQSSSNVASTDDQAAALKTDAVDIPKDAADGVSLTSQDGTSLDIGLPGASQAGDGQQVAPGVVAYSSGNGSANAVQAENDGSVRMLTIIDNANAPRTYDYEVTIPDGGSIKLTPDGGAIGLDSEGNTIARVNVPWATDAKGKSVKTWFTTDGTTLTQHIRHNVRGVTYPVTADPRITFGWTGVTYHLSPTETEALISGGITALGGLTKGVSGAITGATSTPIVAKWANDRHMCAAIWMGYGMPYVITYPEQCR